MFAGKPSLRLSAIARQFGGEVVRDGEFSGLGMLRNAGAAMLTVYYDDRFRAQLDANSVNFSCVLTTPSLASSMPDRLGVLACARPIDLFLRLHVHLCTAEPEFYHPDRPSQISPDARIHPTAVLANRNVVIGPRTVIHPHSVIAEHTTIGADCMIGPGVSVGGDGFEMRYVDGVVTYIPHAGGVRIGDRVHVLANSAVARSLFGGRTTIGDDTKLDQLVHIAHAAQIGTNVRICGCTSVNGATRIGDHAWIGPNVAIANSLLIGEKAWIAMGSAVARDVPPGQRVSGTFARAMP